MHLNGKSDKHMQRKKKKAQTDSFGIQTDYKNLETHK